MKVLFLDDDAGRHGQFLMQTIGCAVTQVWTAPEAIAALDAAEEPFDLASLDHDLGGRVYVMDGEAGPEGTGLDVARHIAGMEPERRPRQVVVHSFNPAGAADMTTTLRAAGVRVQRIMFGQFKVSA